MKTPEEMQQIAQMRAMALRGEEPQTQMLDADTFSAIGGALAGLGPRSVQAMSQGLVQRGDALRQLAMDDRRQVSAERHQQTQEDLQRQQLQQGRWSLSNPGYGQTYKIDGKTGAIIPVGEERERPPPRGAEAADAKEWKDFTDSLSTVKGRANLNADNQKRLYASERLKALAQIPDPTPQQVEEIAMASAQLASGSAATEGAIRAMLPKGMGMKSADFKEWLTNEPHGAGQQAFVKIMLDQAEREEKVIHGQLLKGQTQALPRFAHLRGANKDKFEAILQGAGVDPSLVDERGLLIQQPGEAGAGGPVTISTPAEFAALPSGAEFIDPKGVHRKKP